MLMLKALVLGLVVAAAVVAFVVLLVGGFVLYLFAGIEAVDDEGNPEDEALPAPSAVALALAPMAPVAARVLLPTRDPGFPADDHTADRHARLRAFQQRETEIRSARSMLTRGY